jgi:hypothetical protein
MRRNIVVLRTSVKLATAMIAVGFAVAACGTIQMGAAAITGNSRISSSALTREVDNLNAAYTADRNKGIAPQRPIGQETQQVLSWLILFKVYEKLAVQHGISVTPGQSQRALQSLATQASQNNTTLVQYFSAGAALPPDLLPELGRAAAIQSQLIDQITGGIPPTTSAGQAAVSSQLGHYQCQAAKSLSIKVNPQYGAYDYRGFLVVLVPPKLAANPIPAPAPQVLQTPPC